jgi:chorismate mutase
MFKEERNKIDELDEQILELLKQRQEIVKELVAKKKKLGIPVKDENREKEIISRLKKIYDDEVVDKIYEEIFDSAHN